MILFTADWHLKLGQKNVPVSWALDRYYEFFQQIWALEKEVRLHIIGGDLFDRLPSMEELELYYKFIASVSCHTIIYPGNHEATKRHKTFFDNLKHSTLAINPKIQIITESKLFNTLGFSVLPYNKLHVKEEIENLSCDVPLFTHVRGEIPPHVKPEVDLARFEEFPIVFAGDLHAHSNTQKNIVYPGSPMTTSFHRNEVTTGYLLIDEENNYSWEWKEFKLPQLIRKTVSSTSEMVPTDYHHTIYEIEGDLQELANIENSDLLDKKVIKRSSEAALVLEKDMSITDELAEYLLYILDIPEDRIPQILGCFNDYTLNSQVG